MEYMQKQVTCLIYMQNISVIKELYTECRRNKVTLHFNYYGHDANILSKRK